MKRVLVVEDELSIREFVVINLSRAGYETVEASSGEEALEIFYHDPDFQVILLDIMMPGIDGIEVCKDIRAKNSTVGIIMLTAKAEEIDKVSGLMSGADDYIAKPFSPSELVARIDNLCKRVDNQNQLKERNKLVEEVFCGPFLLDTRKRSLSKNGVQIELTQIEYQIIEFLMINSDRMFDRMAIARRVWGDGYIGAEKIVDVNVRRLRMKIEDDPSEPRCIATVWGKGYKWNSKLN